MELLHFIADWILNIIGALIIGAFCILSILVLVVSVVGVFTSKDKPKQGLIGQVEESVSGGMSGCFILVVYYVFASLVCGFGLWLIDLL